MLFNPAKCNFIPNSNAEMEFYPFIRAKIEFYPFIRKERYPLNLQATTVKRKASLGSKTQLNCFPVLHSTKLFI